MSENVSSEELYTAAREFLRGQGDGCRVGIFDVLDHLDTSFNAEFPLFATVDDVVYLIEGLWRDPHVTRPANWSIDFAWNEEGDGRAGGLRNFPDTTHLPSAERLRAQLAWRRGEPMETPLEPPDGHTSTGNGAGRAGPASVDGERTVTVTLEDRSRHLLALMRNDDHELLQLMMAAVGNEDDRRRIRRVVERRDRRAIAATLVRLPESGDEAFATVINDANTYSDGRPVTSSVVIGEETLYVVNEPPNNGTDVGARTCTGGSDA